MRRKFLNAAGLVAIGAIGATLLWHSPALIGANAAAENDTYRQLNLFGDIFDRVRSDYVERPDERQLIEAAINGMLSSLDPHSGYLTPEENREMTVQTRGEFGGLGIQVTMEDGVVKVVSPIDDTPASRAGIKPNDLIIGIDGESVQGLTLGQAVEKMRGAPNTTIVLTITREGSTEPLEIKLTREIIQIRSVRHEIEDDVGYIRISTFSEQTSDNLEQAIREINAQAGDRMKGYIIDLRNNPGGLLEQAVQVSSAFLERGEIVSTRGRNADEIERRNARGGDLLEGKPVVVLINGGSASASEIVAGALQDHERATVIGTRSFGKGSVQTVIQLGSYGALRLTTARYYTPSGRSIQAQGIEPNIIIEQEIPEEERARLESRSEATLRGHLTSEDGEEQSGSPTYIPSDKADDTQLQFALKYLRGEVVTDAAGATTNDEKAKAN